MCAELNATHDPALRSWVASANTPETDFPIQNLPFGVFRTAPADPPRGGVALGEAIIDLARLLERGLVDGAAARAAQAAAGASLAPLLACPTLEVSALRARLADLYGEGNLVDRDRSSECLVPAGTAELLMPLRPTAFTDFCTSIDHIRRMGGDPPKLCAMSLPVAYNGRTSSVRASGTPVIRPCGQFEVSQGSGKVQFGPEPLLDFELEFGSWLRGGNALGVPISVAAAEQMLFGCCLVNDWSARGIQFFESLLGPHLGKSFLTTISPWIVTMEALAPFRVGARERSAGEPAVPGYLSDAADRCSGALNIELTADLESSTGARVRLTRCNLAGLYWTLAQMVAHQASNGAPLESGDLIATGTVSGPTEGSRACLAEITLKGGTPIELPDGSTRTMLSDGDTLRLRGRAKAEGYVSVGFGPCVGTIHPARGAT